ncbi:YkgJ family cysteine cluster protein [Paludisphaera rhizosphaerae]|uniref:YkgJ family cysteine cluster protein n=1 Tax=Paludisphaera rhizosphaerae TaxID=2711216 RepID=UPI0013E9D74A|nr:YkgJ family cysteine cluster protein [Paludisphaera rhizosphaerae]
MKTKPKTKSKPPLLPLPRKPRRDELKPGESLCDYCTGKCCRYFSTPIDEPTTWDDFDAIRWYLAHGQTMIYVHDETWYLLVSSDCQYLLPDHRCAIYEDRPKICREYTTKDCEYDDEWSFEKAFETPEQIWEYADALLPPRRQAKEKSKPTSTLLPIVTPPLGFQP